MSDRPIYKVGDRLICIDNEDVEFSLDLGKEYTVLCVRGGPADGLKHQYINVGSRFEEPYRTTRFKLLYSCSLEDDLFEL